MNQQNPVPAKRSAPFTVPLSLGSLMLANFAGIAWVAVARLVETPTGAAVATKLANLSETVEAAPQVDVTKRLTEWKRPLDDLATPVKSQPTVGHEPPATVADETQTMVADEPQTPEPLPQEHVVAKVDATASPGIEFSATNQRKIQAFGRQFASAGLMCYRGGGRLARHAARSLGQLASANSDVRSEMPRLSNGPHPDQQACPETKSASAKEPPFSSGPMTGRHLRIHNPRRWNVAVNCALNGKVYKLKPGETLEWEFTRSAFIHFHRGRAFGYASRRISSGDYEFRFSSRGWEIYGVQLCVDLVNLTPSSWITHPRVAVP